MLDEVKVRERKSAKHGKTYEYRFEIAQVGGERKGISKGGFLTQKEAKKAGLEAWKRYCRCGLPRGHLTLALLISLMTGWKMTVSTT